MKTTLTPSALYMSFEPDFQTSKVDATQIVSEYELSKAFLLTFSFNATQISSPSDFFDIIGTHVFIFHQC